jgi:hypothetical protein
MVLLSAPAMAASPAERLATPRHSPINVQSLLQGRTSPLGSIGSFELSATLETLERGGGLSLDRSAVNGLVVTVFVDQEYEIESRDLSHVHPGVLHRTVAARLEALAPDAHTKFADFLGVFIPAKTGDVVGFDLNLLPEARKSLPIDRVIVVVFAKGRSNESAEVLDGAFDRVINDAKKARLDALVVPSIGYQWKDKNSLTFDDIYQPFFRALERSSGPLKISLSLYSGWPSFVIEDVVATLNREASKARFQARPR